ncbi:MAG: sigma-70 family RNA polymerase sigma factor [Fibrobacterota bacterium]|nr:MAG: sigma-70 family RNA polymerase sigma factor [Fibrobacterota bacterium]
MDGEAIEVKGVGAERSATDRLLAKRLSSGDTKALTEIVKSWQAPLERYLTRLCGGCKGDKDEILQEVFLKVYRHANLYDPALPFSAWIYRICRNEMASRMRLKTGSLEAGEIPDEVAESIWGTVVDLPDAHLSSKEDARMIGEVVNAMPDKFRDVFILRFLEEKDYAEIGDILQENVNTVATRIRRAREWFMEHAKARGLVEPSSESSKGGR